MKKFILPFYLISIIFIITFIFFNLELFSFTNLSNYVGKYEIIRKEINDNLFFACVIYIFVSIFWIAFFGITSILLLISIMLFGYISCVLNVFAFTLGSLLLFKIINLYKYKVSELLKNRFVVKSKTFEFYILFRLIPGLPFFMKNLAAIFFNLTTKKFVSAVVISETPQILFFSYFINSFLKSGEEAISRQDLRIISDQMIIPTACLILFFSILFFLKHKIWDKKIKNDNDIKDKFY